MRKTKLVAAMLAAAICLAAVSCGGDDKGPKTNDEGKELSPNVSALFSKDITMTTPDGTNGISGCYTVTLKASDLGLTGDELESFNEAMKSMSFGLKFSDGDMYGYMRVKLNMDAFGTELSAILSSLPDQLKWLATGETPWLKAELAMDDEDTPEESFKFKTGKDATGKSMIGLYYPSEPETLVGGVYYKLDGDSLEISDSENFMKLDKADDSVFDDAIAMSALLGSLSDIPGMPDELPVDF